MTRQRINLKYYLLLIMCGAMIILSFCFLSLASYHSIDIHDIDTFLYEQPELRYKAAELVVIKLKPREDMGMILLVNGAAVYSERIDEDCLTFRFQMPAEDVYLSILLTDKTEYEEGYLGWS